MLYQSQVNKNQENIIKQLFSYIFEFISRFNKLLKYYMYEITTPRPSNNIKPTPLLYTHPPTHKLPPRPPQPLPRIKIHRIPPLLLPPLPPPQRHHRLIRTQERPRESVSPINAQPRTGNLNPSADSLVLFSLLGAAHECQFPGEYLAQGELHPCLAVGLQQRLDRFEGVEVPLSSERA